MSDFLKGTPYYLTNSNQIKMRFNFSQIIVLALVVIVSALVMSQTSWGSNKEMIISLIQISVLLIIFLISGFLSIMVVPFFWKVELLEEKILMTKPNNLFKTKLVWLTQETINVNSIHKIVLEESGKGRYTSIILVLNDSSTVTLLNFSKLKMITNRLDVLDFARNIAKKYDLEFSD